MVINMMKYTLVSLKVHISGWLIVRGVASDMAQTIVNRQWVLKLSVFKANLAI